MIRISRLVFLVGVLLCVLCACSSDKERATSDVTITKAISWLDYEANGNSNVTDVRYGKCSTTSIGGYFFTPVNEGIKEKEEINAFHISTICPYCDEEGTSGFSFDELPSEKLGDETVVIKTDVVCPNWSNHTNTGTSDYSASIILTLNDKD